MSEKLYEEVANNGLILELEKLYALGFDDVAIQELINHNFIVQISATQYIKI